VNNIVSMFAHWDAESTSRKRMRGGIYLYAAGSIAAGILDLIWGEFEAAHQPIQALGDHIPGRAVLASIAAIWLIGGGAAILWRRLARAGASALAAIYLIFAGFWLPRFYTAVHLMGFKIPVVIGVFAGVGQQLILVAAAGIVHASLVKGGFASTLRTSLVRWAFGLCSIAFGLAHLTGVPQVSAMVPKWMPLGGNVWAILTGIAFVAAGMAMLSQILDLLAARLLALMLLVFSVLVLAPAPLARPHNHRAWGSNAYNLAAVGAAATFAESIAIRRRGHGNAVMIEDGPDLDTQSGSPIVAS
jgi:uncharacterized membrane protein